MCMHVMETQNAEGNQNKPHSDDVNNVPVGSTGQKSHRVPFIWTLLIPLSGPKLCEAELQISQRCPTDRPG